MDRPSVRRFCLLPDAIEQRANWATPGRYLSVCFLVLQNPDGIRAHHLRAAVFVGN